MIESSENQPVAWSADFDQRPHNDYGPIVPFNSDAERLLAVRKSNETRLQFLNEREALYINPDAVPFILKADMDMFRLRLALTNELGEELPPQIAMDNIKALIEGKHLHNNGVANLLLKDFENEQ